MKEMLGGRFSIFSRILALVLTLTLLLSNFLPLAAAFGDEVRIRVDGEILQIRYGQPPVIVDGRTLVPLRDVMSHLGFEVEWDYQTETVHLEKPGYEIVVPLGQDSMTVNGRTVYLEVPAMTMNGRTLVPIRAISEAIGFGVNWIAEALIVDIRTDGSEIHRRHDIDWHFSVYSEPDFRATRIVTFGPQAVSVLYETEDGWGLVSTYRGNYWTYLQSNRRYIERRMGVYEYMGAAVPAWAIDPQVVHIVQQEGSWLLIHTWLGPRWINLNFTPPTHTLDNLLRRWGNNVSVYFENIETGFIYRYNPGRIYHGASVPKAPFSMYIYQKADRGETNLDSRIAFPRGGTLTQREMLRRNLMYSCNDSTIGLRNAHGSAGYRRWVADLGGNPDWVWHSIMGSRLNVDEAARFARAIYDYIESDARHAAEFRRHLLNNRIPFIVSSYPIASKTGWTSTVQHDMAIIYADSPYILVILSSRITQRDFREISMAFENFNNAWFVY